MLLQIATCQSSDCKFFLYSDGLLTHGAECNAAACTSVSLENKGIRYFNGSVFAGMSAVTDMWVGHFLQCTAILIIFEGQFQIVQLLSSSKLVLKDVESCFVALNYHENGSMSCMLVRWWRGYLRACGCSKTFSVFENTWLIWNVIVAQRE